MTEETHPKKEKTYLALGDSYTIGQSVPENARWPNQLVDALKNQKILFTNAEIIAQTGWRTDNLQEAVSKNVKFDYDMVSLLIGVNDQYQNVTLKDYEPKFRKILETAVAKAGGNANHVFVVSIPDYGYTPFGQNNRARISTEIDAFNALNEAICKEKNIKYFNITDISRSNMSGLVASDGLHPSEKQYSIWVQRMIQDVYFESFR